MKKIVVLLAFLSVFVASCASVPLTKENLTKQVVVDLPGLSKDAIYKKSLEWIAVSFGSGKEVLEYQNKEDGKIIGNISTVMPSLVLSFKAGSSLTIEAKDGKARLTYLLKETIGPDWRRPIDGLEVADGMKSLDSATDSYRAFFNQKDSSNW